MLLLQLRPKLSSVREGILERVNFQEKRPKLLLRVELAEVFSMTKAHSELVKHLTARRAHALKDSNVETKISN